MSQIIKPETIMGKLIGFSKHWNPFKNEIYALVEVDSEVFNVTIDYRQMKFIQKEYPVNSLVPLTIGVNGWQINSTPVVETWEIREANSVFS